MRIPQISDEALMQPPERSSPGAAFDRLVAIMARLRAPNGCPWDLAQTLDTLRPYLLEEAHEVLESLNDPKAHQEELGDLLLQVVFHAEVRRQEGRFGAAEVVHGIADKLVRRHPHVFGGASADGPTQAYANWEKEKAKEKVGRSAVDGVPHSLPALVRAQRISDKAARVGFDFLDVRGPLEKLEEETKELKRAIDDAKAPSASQKEKDHVADELGDVLFSLVNVARFLDVTSEDALARTTNRFERRFRSLEAEVRASGRAIDEVPFAELEELWQRAKQRVG